MKETIENLEEGVERNTDKGYEIGTMEEAQKFSENRKMKFPNRIESPHILLRTPEPTDSQLLYDGIIETLSDLRSFPYSWLEYIGPQSISNCQSICNIDYTDNIGLPIPFLIFKEEKFCGQLKITRVESDLIEVGFWIRHSQQSQGIMTDALKCFCEWVRKTYPNIFVVLGIQKENKSAIRLAEKCGFLWSNSYVNAGRNNTVFEVFYWGAT